VLQAKEKKTKKFRRWIFEKKTYDYRAFKKIWSLKITVIAHKHICKHLGIFANFLQHPDWKISQITSDINVPDVSNDQTMSVHALSMQLRFHKGKR
jgi:isoprenylcysteine carboxyl methyltransferase (ICMT) family protein YpbQ